MTFWKNHRSAGKTNLSGFITNPVFSFSKLISKICLIYRKTCLLNIMAFFFTCLEATAALMWLYINKMELNFLAKVSLVSLNLCFFFVI